MTCKMQRVIPNLDLCMIHPIVDQLLNHRQQDVPDVIGPHMTFIELAIMNECPPPPGANSHTLCQNNLTQLYQEGRRIDRQMGANRSIIMLFTNSHPRIFIAKLYTWVPQYNCECSALGLFACLRTGEFLGPSRWPDPSSPVFRHRGT